MGRFLQIFSIVLAGIAVGVADAFIKKTSIEGQASENFFSLLGSAVKNPYLLAAFFLYLLQFIFFIYVFSRGWKLGIVSNIQNVFFSVTAICIGYFFFEEKLNLLQGVGAALAIVGVFLMNM